MTVTARPAAPAGRVTAAQAEALIDVTRRTKALHDLLAAFADRYAAFPPMADRQAGELASLRRLLARQGIADPEAGFGPGVFACPGAQARYDRDLAEGRAGRAAALGVIRRAAADVVRQLGDLLPGLPAPDARSVCLRVLVAAHRQIRTALVWSSR